MRQSARAAWAVSAALALAACRRPTEVVVSFDAAPQTRLRAAAVRVRACNQDGERILDRVVSFGAAEVDGGVAGEWPLHVPLVPRAGDAARRFVVVADAIDVAGQTFSRARVVGGYRRDESLSLTRLLDDACQGVLTCGRSQTCAAGACADARAAIDAEAPLPCDPTIACAGPPCPSYDVGATWQRSRDWRPGVRLTSAEGNPAPDAAGLPTWQYEITTGGGGLQTATPWYEQPSRLAVWDDAWYDAGGAWARGDNVGPDALPAYVDAILGDPAGYSPLVRWLNPSARDVVVDVRGSLRLLWQGGAVDDVDVIVGRARADGRVDPLLARTVAKADDLTLPVDLRGVAVGASETLIFSVRGRDAAGWITFLDAVTITLAATR